MSDVISFLERMGRDARLREAGLADLDAEMIRISLDEKSRTAILAQDQSALEALLQAKKNVCCMVYPVEDSE